MLSQSDMNAVVEVVTQKEGSYVTECLIKESKAILKYMPDVIKVFEGNLKEKSFLFSSCEVSGLFKKKINYAMLYGKDTFYYCENRYRAQYVIAKYEDIESVKKKSVDLTITLKDKSKLKICTHRAESIYDFLNTILNMYYPVSDSVEEKPVEEPKKKTTKKAEAPSKEVKEATKTKAASKPATKKEPKAAPAPKAASATKAEPKAEPKPAPKAASATKAEPKADPKPDPKAAPTPKTAPVAETKPAPKPAPVKTSEPIAKAEAKPAPAPVEAKPVAKSVKKTVKSSGSVEARLNKLKSEMPDSEIIKVFEFATLPVLDEVVPVEVCGRNSLNDKDSRALVADIRGYLLGARGMAFIDSMGLTVEQDTYLRKFCRDNRIIFKIYKSTYLKKAMEDTPKECAIDFLNKNGGRFACIFFNNLDDILSLKKYLISKKLDILLDKICLDDTLVSIRDLDTYEVELRDEIIIQNTGIDSYELLSVVIQKNLFAFGKTSENELSGFITDSSIDSKAILNGKLPLTLIEDVNIRAAIDLASAFTNIGYQVDIIDKSGKPIWDRLENIKNKIFEIEEFNTKAQILYCEKAEDSAFMQGNDGELYRVIIDDYCGKIAVIKCVKECTGLGLKETKELCESAPKLVREVESLSEAQKIVRDIEEAGGQAHVEVGGRTISEKEDVYVGSDIQVYLDYVGTNKMEVIKQIRYYLGLDLKTSKELAESYPCSLGSFDEASAAFDFANVLEAAGAQVTVSGLIESDEEISIDELVVKYQVDLELINANGHKEEIIGLSGKCHKNTGVNASDMKNLPAVINRGLTVKQGEYLVSEIHKFGGEAELKFSGCVILNDYEKIRPTSSILDFENLNPAIHMADSVRVLLKDYGNKKISVIQVVKEELGLGLKETKDLVERVPVYIREGITNAEADDLIARLKDAGADAEKRI